MLESGHEVSLASRENISGTICNSRAPAAKSSVIMSSELTATANRLSWAGQLIAAGIIGSTTFFKLSGAQESVDLFTTLGVEPWGRIGLGIVEVITVILLLMPRTAALGGVMALGIISGAIFSHLTVLGIVYNDDGGSLFMMAVIVFVASALVSWLRRKEIPIIGAKFA